MNKLDFGIEQEFLILSTDGKPPSHEEMDNLFSLLIENGFSVFIENEEKKIIAIKTKSQYGNLIISNDAVTNLLEITFPPFAELNSFVELYSFCYNLTIKFLNKLNLAIYNCSIFEKFPSDFVIRATNKRKERFYKFANYNFDNKYFIKYFPVIISATQIHLNILNNTFYQNLKKYYFFEYLFPLLYSNGKKHETHKAFNLRTLIYRDNTTYNYLANAFPFYIPKNKAEYDEIIVKKIDFFRDYSFICPRPDLNTVEFRTTDTQFETENILEIIS